MNIAVGFEQLCKLQTIGDIQKLESQLLSTKGASVTDVSFDYKKEVIC